MRFLVAIHHPDGYQPASEGPEMAADIDRLNEEMQAKGAVVFVGGLAPAEGARAIRVRADGAALITDGPYLETKEHIGGFWVLEVADADEAVEWGRKASIACRAPVEVRAFNPEPSSSHS
jgi:hypothetical protein